MRTDRNPLFRDKAACALASDQIHLTPGQRVAQFEGLIDALGDLEPQVRAIAIQALKILTGQTKDYRPGASPDQRAGRRSPGGGDGSTTTANRSESARARELRASHGAGARSAGQPQLRGGVAADRT
jgi:hypothetical protein